MYFNPRPPRGGRPLTNFLLLLLLQFQSTPPARGATAVIGYVGDICAISIHAPREGGDLPIGEAFSGVLLFQSTPPARGATLFSVFPFTSLLNFNPRPPRGGRHRRHDDYMAYERISIHAPREGGDRKVSALFDKLRYFNPRPPRGGRLFTRYISSARSRSYFNPRPPRGGRRSFLSISKV